MKIKNHGEEEHDDAVTRRQGDHLPGQNSCPRQPLQPKGMYISEVRTSSNPNLMVIIVKEENQSDRIMIWDALENIEYKMYDVDNPYEILWDATGDPYIVT